MQSTDKGQDRTTSAQQLAQLQETEADISETHVGPIVKVRLEDRSCEEVDYAPDTSPWTTFFSLESNLVLELREMGAQIGNFCADMSAQPQLLTAVAKHSATGDCCRICCQKL